MDLNRNGVVYFYISIPQNDKEIILHIENCQDISNPLRRKYVGLFSSQRYALQKLKTEYPQVKVCKKCIKDW